MRQVPNPKMSLFVRDQQVDALIVCQSGPDQPANQRGEPSSLILVTTELNTVNNNGVHHRYLAITFNNSDIPFINVIFYIFY